MVTITVLKPGRKPETLTFDQPMELTIGRSSNCAICLDFDPMVSRMHAVLLVEPPGIRIKDLNSTNGISVNGTLYGGFSSEKLAQPHELSDGDEVLVGCTLFRVSTSGEDAASGHIVTELPERGAEPDDGADRTISLGQNTKQWPFLHGSEKNLEDMQSSLPEIPGYHLTSYLGKGRPGELYFGMDDETGGPVAVKTVMTDAPFSSTMLEGFTHDILGKGRFTHPHLIRLMDAGALGQQGVFMVMEYVNGEDLSSYLARCPRNRIPLSSAYQIMLQIAEALCYAHQHGLLHLDLTPKSVFLFDVNGRMQAKVGDLGQTRSLEDAGLIAAHAMASDAFGLRYIAPEQLAELRDAKPSVDVFALAAVFYEMLTGAAPYNLSDDDPAGNVNHILDGQVVPIEERTRDLPEPLVVAIDRALSPEPEERYQNCCDFLDALKNVRI